MLSANYHNHTQMQEIFKLQRLKPKMIISQKDFTQDISSYWIKNEWWWIGIYQWHFVFRKLQYILLLTLLFLIPYVFIY